MTDTIRDQAATALADIGRVTAAILPEPGTAIVALDAAPPGQADEIRRRMAELDMTNTQSIISFGSSSQAELQVISQEMLAGVKTKDVGPAGNALTEIVSTIRGFSGQELDVNRKRSWWDRLTGAAAPLAQFIARYEEVQTQIDRITENLLQHETTLLKDIKSLDILYIKTLTFYDELGLYISAGQAKLKELDTTTIPAKQAEVTATPEQDQLKKAQELRDLRSARDDLERRVYDLQLTRQVTMQSLPSIRLVQENDKSLVGKINSTLMNTVPLWETQLAQAVTIQRSKEAAEAIKGANDLTNQLLTENATNLQETNRIVRTEMERGVFDIQSVQLANQTLIDTIQESLAIADQGRARRASAEVELAKMQTALKDTLSAARASRTDPGDAKGGALESALQK